MLRAIGDWLAVNGEAIYGTRPWKIYGQGPTEMVSGHMQERENKDKGYTAEDVRFTTKGNTLYAICLAWPEGKTVNIPALKTGSEHCSCRIVDVELLGSDRALTWTRDENGLCVRIPGKKPCEHAFAFEISLAP